MWMFWEMYAPVWAPEDESGSGEASPDGAPAGDADGSAEAASGDAGDAAAPSKGDEGSPEGENAGDDGETDDKGEPEPLTISLSDDFADFQEIADEYAVELDAFLKENPDAKPADIAKASAEYMLTREAKLRQDWHDQTTSDKELNEGGKRDENIALANKALSHFGTEKLIEELRASGFGNHPEMVKAFWRMGKLMSDADLEPSGGSVNAFDPLAARYGSK